MPRSPSYPTTPSLAAFLLTIGLAPVSCGGASDQLAYRYEDRGRGRCFAGNDAGSLVGVDDSLRAFLLTPTGAKDYLSVRAGDTLTSGLSINTGGEVVGYGEGPVGRAAVRWRDGAWSDLGALAAGAMSMAMAVGDDGAVVGVSAVTALPGTSGPGAAPAALPFKHAFLMPAGGAMKDLGVLGGQNSSASAVAAGGVVAGILDIASGDTHAFLYAHGALKDLGTLGGKNSAAYGVNRSGDVVGVSEMADGASHAFLYTAGAMTDLGTLGGDRSDARAINDAGVIVGNSYGADGRVHPFVYVDRRMIDITPRDADGTPFTMARAESISPAGKIAGWGVAASPPGGTTDTVVRCLSWVKK